jgi:cytochrome c556
MLAVTMFAVGGLTVGLSLADDEETPLGKLMEKVNSKNTAIRNAVKTEVKYKKAQAKNEISTNTKALIELGKEAKKLAKDAAKTVKNVTDPEKKWGELSDEFIKELEKFEKLVGKAETKQAEAKSAWSSGPSKSCTNCHNVFRVQDDGNF